MFKNSIFDEVYTKVIKGRKSEQQGIRSLESIYELLQEPQYYKNYLKVKQNDKYIILGDGLVIEWAYKYSTSYRQAEDFLTLYINMLINKPYLAIIAFEYYKIYKDEEKTINFINSLQDNILYNNYNLFMREVAILFGKRIEGRLRKLKKGDLTPDQIYNATMLDYVEKLISFKDHDTCYYVFRHGGKGHKNSYHIIAEILDLLEVNEVEPYLNHIFNMTRDGYEKVQKEALEFSINYLKELKKGNKNTDIFGNDSENYFKSPIQNNRIGTPKFVLIKGFKDREEGYIMERQNKKPLIVKEIDKATKYTAIEILSLFKKWHITTNYNLYLVGNSKGEVIIDMIFSIQEFREVFNYLENIK